MDYFPVDDFTSTSCVILSTCRCHTHKTVCLTIPFCKGRDVHGYIGWKYTQSVGVTWHTFIKILSN